MLRARKRTEDLREAAEKLGQSWVYLLGEGGPLCACSVVHAVAMGQDIRTAVDEAFAVEKSRKKWWCLEPRHEEQLRCEAERELAQLTGGDRVAA